MTLTSTSVLPKIIQGGMGVYISTPFLARSVAMLGGLGTVSGVAPERILARILGKGDPGGHYRRALEHFPYPEIAKEIINTYYIEEGNALGLTQRAVPVYSMSPPRLLISLILCANFALVWLAKEGHANPVSINYLEKIAMPLVYAITGAMLAHVDVITMGAGLPLNVPEVINALFEGRIAEYPIPVVGEKDRHRMSFDPEKFFGKELLFLRKPAFVPIIASNILAKVCAQKLDGDVFGFVVEEPTAGGHNAPPRGKVVLDTNGEPAYGERDKVDYRKLADLGYPFWIGGSYASPEKLKEALSLGATGVQVGSAFALCEQSGMNPVMRKLFRKLGFLGQLQIHTSVTASPTHYPFKVAVMPGSLSERDIYDARERVCNQGALATVYEKPDGTVGYRCPAEPVSSYLAKGGAIEDTIDVRCICNGLLATSDLGNDGEPMIFTLGNDVTRFLQSIMSDENDSYDVADVFKYLLVEYADTYNR